jgi:hypothetical protein
MYDKQERMAVVGRSAGRKAQREHDAKVAADAVRSYVNGQARPAGKTSLTPTQYAERVPMVVGGIVLLAAMNWLLHALLYSLAAVFTVVCGCSVVPWLSGAGRLGGGCLSPRPCRRRGRAPRSPQ